MVEINSIKTTACPICGCKLITLESVETDMYAPMIRRHTNGTAWEKRQFACGYEVSFVPNFNCEQVTHICRFDPEIETQNKLKEQAKQAVLEQIDAAECSDEYKKRLRYAIAQI